MAFWTGRHRFVGLVPIGIATLLLAQTSTPDILISRDGHHVGVTTEEGRLLSLRESRSSYASDNLTELAGVEAEPIAMIDWPKARCSKEFCVLSIDRGGREWHLLMARSRELVEERALAAACEKVDIVVADRFLPASCKPRWLKADRNLLDQTGGMALKLGGQSMETVASREGEHGWWRPDSR